MLIVCLLNVFMSTFNDQSTDIVWIPKFRHLFGSLRDSALMKLLVTCTTHYFQNQNTVTCSGLLCLKIDDMFKSDVNSQSVSISSCEKQGKAVGRILQTRYITSLEL